MADRFDDTPDLIELANTKGWRYRLRLTANRRAVVEGCSTTLAPHAGRSGCSLSNVERPTAASSPTSASSAIPATTNHG
jgi:hypothetical protein